MKFTIALAILTAAAARADPASFQKDVLPVLSERCGICHAAGNPQANLVLASHKTLLEGGLSGSVIRPGNPDQSLLIEYISGEKPRMPKVGPPLTPQQVELIRRWIVEGAKDDTVAAGSSSSTWWSLRPLVKPPVPKLTARTPVDAFILAKLGEKGLTPSPEAGRRVLIRRLTYDLLGLPPTPEEIEAFLADRSPDAYEKLVDRLLASPRYGERWARHWLDVVHYGDSHGYDKDKPRPNAWPYRDYVIRSFNKDKPYARFVEEQLAGDILFPDDPEGVVATGFIAAGPWDFVGHMELREGTTDKHLARLLDRDDMVAATMSTFVSLTAHCARCHDHKFDPIKQEDYYSLQAVFAGVDRADRPYDLDPATHLRRQELLRRKLPIQIELQPYLDKVDQATSPEIVQLDDQTREWRQELAQLGTTKNDAEIALRKTLQEKIDQAGKRRKELVDGVVGPATLAEIDRLTRKINAEDQLLEKLPKPLIVYAGSDFFDRKSNFRPSLVPRPIHLLVRGNLASPGPLMTSGTVSCVNGLPARFADGGDEGSRRAALAKWITDPSNMLAWRSIVNRVWHHHFGAGLADTPNDFGRMGSQPTHPELLDWLAVWFRDDAQGSLKKLHKLITTSSVYRQSSGNRPDAHRVDSENRYLWRMNRPRLDAESIRDSALQVSGKLDLTMGGPAVRQFFFKDDHSPTYDYARFDPDSPEAYRRSIYRFIARSVPDPFMDRLDCPDSSLLTPKRSTTLTAIQALALLNNPFMIRASQHFAERIRKSSGELSGQIAAGYRLALGREPAETELRMLVAHAEKHGLENVCRLIFNSNEFLFID